MIILKSTKVKVFDAYFYDKEGDEYYRQFDLGWHSLFDFHNQIVDKDGYVSDGPLKIKPRPQDMKEVTRFEFDDMERKNYKIHQDTIKMYEDKLKQAEKDLTKWMEEAIKLTGFSPDGCYLGDWDCELSPFGICVCRWDGNDETCIYCGEPDERK